MARRGFRKKLDSVHWSGNSITFSGQSAGQAANTFSPAQHLPETLLRIRGEWLASLDGALEPGVLVGVACGLINVPEGTGTTVLWSPFTDADALWIWWDFMTIGLEEGVANIYEYAGLSVGRRVIDNKSMRRVRNQELQVVMENTTLVSAGAVNVTVGARILSGQS